MRTRKMMSALAIGALAMFGTVAAGPGQGQGEGPPEQAQSEQACQGLNEARGEEGGNGAVDEDHTARDVLDAVEELLTGEEDGCAGEGSASGDRGPGNGGG